MPGVTALKAEHGSLAANGHRSPRVVGWQGGDQIQSAAPQSDADAAAYALSAAHPALRELSEQSRRALLRWSRFRSVKRRAIVWDQGDDARSVILVVNGSLKRSAPLSDGGEVLLDLVGPGNCVGYTSVLLDRAHDASLTALSDCLLLMIDARQFRHAFEHEPDAMLAILRSMADELHSTTQQLLDDRGQTTPGRLAKVLLRLPRAPSSGSGGPTRLCLRLSQSELGAMTGVCREVVNRYLGIWRDAGWIETSGGMVTSFDMAVIVRLSRNETSAEAGRTALSWDHTDRGLRLQDGSGGRI